QTRSKVNKSYGAHAFIEPKKISQALKDESWFDVMQEELLQFKIQKVWILVDLPFGKKEIRTKWVYRNKKDERGVVVRNKAGKGLTFSRRITPLFSTMLASTEVEEGEGLEQPIKSQPPPSPTQPSVGDQPHVTESSFRPDNTHSPNMNLEGTGGNEGDQV
ncbi:hypothetical protein Tco_1557134, partial [Tanacetum coccineum]